MKGIKLGKGGASRDFSNGDGFYLTASFDYVKGLPKRSEAVMLMFDITRLSQFTEKDLSTDKKSWEMMVKQNHCGRKHQTIKLPKDNTSNNFLANNLEHNFVFIKLYSLDQGWDSSIK